MKITRTKKKTDIRDFNFLIYGGEKIGKTTLCSFMSKPVFIPTEPGLVSVEVDAFDQVTSWNGFKEILNFLNTEKPDYDTVIIDTADRAYDLCSEHYCKEMGVSYSAELPYGKVTGAINTEFKRVINKLGQLPYSIIFTSHEKETSISTATVERSVVRPSLAGEGGKYIIGAVDIILYCNIEHKRNSKGEFVPQRTIHAAPNPRHSAGGRREFKPGKFPMDINELTKAFKKGGGEKNNGQ